MYPIRSAVWEGEKVKGEDRHLVHRIDDERILFVVADGASSTGEDATATGGDVAQFIVDESRSNAGMLRSAETLVDLMVHLNEESTSRHGSAYSTMSAMLITGEEAYFAAVGDSLILQLEHELVQLLPVDSISYADAEAFYDEHFGRKGHSPERRERGIQKLRMSFLSSGVGYQGEGNFQDYIYKTRCDLRANQRYLLGTDGLTDAGPEPNSQFKKRYASRHMKRYFLKIHRKSSSHDRKSPSGHDGRSSAKSKRIWHQV